MRRIVAVDWNDDRYASLAGKCGIEVMQDFPADLNGIDLLVLHDFVPLYYFDLVEKAKTASVPVLHQTYASTALTLKKAAADRGFSYKDLAYVESDRELIDFLETYLRS